MPACSIIIPVFNHSALTQQCLKSVLATSSAAAEIIVVDDGSTDDTPELLRGFGAQIRVLTGACLLVRREIFEAAGGFDASFRNGMEDVDFCLRLGALGHEIHYCCECELFHLESQTRGQDSAEVMQNEKIYQSRWRAKIAPDDFFYYLEDGLVTLEYGCK